MTVSNPIPEINNNSTNTESLTHHDPKIMKNNQIVKLLQTKSRSKKAVRTFLYTFADVKAAAVDSLVSTLKELPSDTSDTIVAGIIFDWYRSLTTNEKIGFAMTDKEYQLNKARNIAAVITSNMTDRQKKNLRGKALLDVGAGDCAMTYLVAQQLQMKSNGVDIQTEIDWGGENSSDKKTKNPYMSQVDHYYVYDGSNLLAALEGKKFKVVMYNHSLHHFPSFQDQLRSLEQAYDALEPGGFLFLSEHANCFEDDILDLSHLLLNLRYSIDKQQITSQEAAEKAIKQFKSEYQSHYFSKNMIDIMTKRFGFILHHEEIRSKDDVAKATFYCFVKASPKHQLKEWPMFFDTNATSRLHHVIETPVVKESSVRSLAESPR